MNRSENEKGSSTLPRTAMLAGMLIATLAWTTSGCQGGFFNENLSEGDRCNPSSSHNECAGGLVCTGQGGPGVEFCPENYCCPLDSNGNINSTNPNCQPGCNGGAAAICLATNDPATCAFAFPDASTSMPEAGPSEAGADAGGD